MISPSYRSSRPHWINTRQLMLVDTLYIWWVCGVLSLAGRQWYPVGGGGRRRDAITWTLTVWLMRWGKGNGTSITRASTVRVWMASSPSPSAWVRWSFDLSTDVSNHLLFSSMRQLGSLFPDWNNMGWLIDWHHLIVLLPLDNPPLTGEALVNKPVPCD